MTAKHPRLRLSRLRDTGWNCWDPIGLLGRGESWEGALFADEYDTYLLRAASDVRRDVPFGDIVYYLNWVEVEQMGLGDAGGDRDRVRSVVQAIACDKDLWSNP